MKDFSSDPAYRHLYPPVLLFFFFLEKGVSCFWVQKEAMHLFTLTKVRIKHLEKKADVRLDELRR